MRRLRLAPALIAAAILWCGLRPGRAAPEAAPLPLATPPSEHGPRPGVAPLAERATFLPPPRVVTPLWIATAAPAGAPTPTPVVSAPPAVPAPPPGPPTSVPAPAPAPNAGRAPGAPAVPILPPAHVVTPLWVATATPDPRRSPTVTVTTAAPTTTPSPTGTDAAEAAATTTPEPCHARVYEREPAEPFDWIGMVEVQARRPTDRLATLVESARRSACRLGGDGIVILYRSSRREGGIVERPRPGLLPNVDLRAAVIRFRR